MVKTSVPKSFIMEQFSIGWSTLYEILKSEENFEKFKAEYVELGLNSVSFLLKNVKKYKTNVYSFLL